MDHDIARPSGDSFDDLLHLARRGDREALGKVLNAFRRVLLHRIERQEPAELRTRCAPSDLVQDTLLEAQRDFAGFQGDTPGELATWLIRILHHNLGDLLRRHARLKRDANRELPLDDGLAVGDLKEQLTDGQPDPEETASRREQAEVTRQALEELPGRAREAVRLRFEERLPFEEVGARLGCSPEAARKLCERALRDLRGIVPGVRDGDQ